MVNRPTANDDFEFDKMQLHYLYMNPAFGVEKGANKYTRNNPNPDTKIDLLAGAEREVFQPMFESAQNKNAMVNARKNPIGVGESEWKDAVRDGNPFTKYQTFIRKMLVETSMVNEQKKLIRLSKNAFKTFPANIGGVWVRYTYNYKPVSGVQIFFDIPLIEGLTIMTGITKREAA